MQSTSIPGRILLPFANSGGKNTIPVASQTATSPGQASYTDGFPPATRTPLAAGGVPPSGQDMNGILNAITAIQQFQSAGAIFPFDATFATSVGGYPKGATVMSTDGRRKWRSLVDANTQDPDNTASTGWIYDGMHHNGPILVSVSRTLTARESVGNLVIASGSTAAISITLPSSTLCDAGSTIAFINASSYNMTVTTANGDAINPSVQAISSVVLKPGDTLSLSLYATNWQAYGGSAQLPYAGNSAYVLSANGGYQSFPSGFTVQWGNNTVQSSGDLTIALPIAFQSACFGAIATIASNSVGYATATNTLTKTSFNLGVYQSSNTRGSAVTYWWAFGV